MRYTHAMFDKKQIKQDFSKAARDYGQSAKLQARVREAAAGLASEYFPRGGLLLDVGCGCVPLAGDEDNGLRVIGVDIAYGMCKAATADGAKMINAAAEKLPFAEACMDGIFSSLMLQWAERPEAVITEFLRVLKPDGVAIITSFVDGTLQELKEAFRTLDDAPHVSDFITGQQLTLKAAHAGAVVLEAQENIYQEEIESAVALMRSIKRIGAANKNLSRKKGLTTRHALQKVETAYRGNIATWQVLTMVISKT